MPDVAASDALKERLETVTAGRYEIRNRLGRGGMAMVYAAWDPALHREVAVKVLSDLLIDDTEGLDRFRVEARTIAALDHPNIMRVHSVEHHERIHFLVLQFIRGRSLDHLLADGERVALPILLTWFAQLGSALDYAHARGVVHRDVKPGNIMVRDTGQAVLTDFGIAKMRAGPRQTDGGRPIGTPLYMSPEQWCGDEVTSASDQYSLGAVIFELLCGRPPFTGSAQELRSSHITSEPPRIESLQHGVPFELAETVHRMMAKDPAKRFHTVSEAALAAGSHHVVDFSREFAALRAGQGHGMTQTGTLTTPGRGIPTATVEPPLPPRSPSWPLALKAGVVAVTTLVLALFFFVKPMWSSRARGSFTFGDHDVSVEEGMGGVVRVVASPGSSLPTEGNPTWRVLDTDVLAISETGADSAAIRGLKRGVGRLEVSWGGIVDTLAVPVVGEAVKAVSVVPPRGSLAPGQAITLRATVAGVRTERLANAVEWQSSNPAVATVDANGRVVAHAAGAAEITATAGGVASVVELRVTQAASLPPSETGTSERRTTGPGNSPDAGAPAGARTGNAAVTADPRTTSSVVRIPATAQLSVGPGGEGRLMTDLRLTPPAGSAAANWCAALELSRVGEAPVLGAGVDIRTQAGTPDQRTLTMAIQELRLGTVEMLATIYLIGSVKLWDTRCGDRRNAPPVQSVELTQVCAQRMVSGDWRPCRGDFEMVVVDPRP